MTEQEEDLLNVGRTFFMVFDEAREARDALDDYDHNADPTGEIEERLKVEFANSVQRLAIWTRALGRRGGA